MVIIMYCTKCGAQNSDEYAYCSNCGAKLNTAVNVPGDNFPINQNPDNTVPVINQDNSVSPSGQQVNPYLNNAQGQNTYVNYQQEYYNPQMKMEQAKFNRLSIAGFVLACCSFVTQEAGWICMILGFVFSIIGLVSKNSLRSRGKGLAIAGIVISGAYLLILIIALMMLGPFFGILWSDYYY